jgi:hypothetical protein
VVAALVVLGAAPAVGQPTDQVRARRLSVEGRKALRAGNCPTALQHLTRSFELDPKPTVAYDIALCHRALRQYGSSISFFRRFLELRGAKLPPWERKRVASFVSEMERKQCHLTLDVGPAGAIVRVDGHDAGAAPLAGPLAVDPGRHLVETSREGYASATQTAEVVEGQSLMVTIKLEKLVRPGVLLVASPAPGATAVIGRGPIRPLPLSVRLPAGEYLVKVVAPNHEPKEQTVTVVDGDVTRVEMVLVPVPEPVGVPAVPASAPVEPPTPVYRRAWFWVTVGAVAVAGAATGGYLGYRSRSGESFDRSLRLR